MSTRSRKRSLAAADEEEEDELSSPVKFTTTPLSTLKRRKLNTYGKSTEKGKRGSIFGRLGGLFGFGNEDGKGKENEIADELADEVSEDEDKTKDNTDVWDVPVSEEEEAQQEKAIGKRTGRRSGATKRKDKAAVVEEDANMEDIWEVESSDTEEVNTSIRSKRTDKLTPKSVTKLKYTSKESEENNTPKRGRPKSGTKLNNTSKELEEDNTSRRGRSKSATKSKDTSNKNEAESTPKRGRPKKEPEGKTANSKTASRKMNVEIAVKPVSPRRFSGRGPRKSDILKKAKALSRQAIREKLMAQAQDEEEETVEEPTRGKSGRHSKVDVEDTHADDKHEVSSARKPGRPRKGLQAVIDSPNAPTSILTPSRKDRTLKTKKSVAFEGKGDLNLGFKDLPKPAKQKSKEQTSIEKPAIDLEEPELASSPKQSRKAVEDLSEGEEDDSDEEDEVECAICSGLKSEKPNEIILCDSCDLAVHQLCYGVPVIPKGDWLCRDCQPDDLLDVDMDDEVDIAKVPSNLPEIPRFEDHLRDMQRVVLDKLTGQKRVKLRGHHDEMQKVHQVVEQTVLAGEGNSMLVIGARGCGKTTLVETVISNLSTDHRENFHVVRLNGFIHTDDKLALKETWRQLGREMEVEDEGGKISNASDALVSLLALLSHPSEISEDRADHTAKSVVFILDEFDLFTTHARQTLLYNLFDIAQARKAPIVVLGLTTRVDVVEALEKRVKSRFSHRYVHLSLPKSLSAFWEICRGCLTADSEELIAAGVNPMDGQEEFISFWQSMIEDLYGKDPAFKHLLQSHFYRTKSMPAFFTSCILPIANLSLQNFPLKGRAFTSNTMSLAPPDSKLHILQGLSELELALLIAAARLDIILDTDTCNFAMAYDEYISLTSRHKIQTSSTGMSALGSSAKIWGREVALGSWEKLADYCLLVPAGIGGGAIRDAGAGGRMWKVDVGLEEITGSVDGISGVMSKWCREI